MKCIIEGCERDERENGLCYHCASHKKYRLRSWRAQKKKEAEILKRTARAEYAEKQAALKAARRRGELEKGKAAARKTTARFGAAKSTASRRGLAWEIPEDTFKAYLQKPCHYCSSPLPVTGSGLDRKDNKLGYFPENVVPCCTACNQIKGANLTYEEMVVAMKAVLLLR